MKKLILISLSFLILACSASSQETTKANPSSNSVATFAGGCFWCLEAAFDKVDGVTKTISGYTGGKKETANYKKVSAGSTGHYEAVQVTYDPKKISYEKLLEVFWENVDPLDGKGQFCDKGTQYLSAIFYKDETEKTLAMQSLNKLQKNKFKNQKIATEILPATEYYDAEKYHQDYHKKNPIRYKLYSTGCGRARRLKEVWK